MRSILALSTAAVVTILLATTAGGRIAAAGPDDCSISGMSGSFACPLSSWGSTSSGTPTAAPAPSASAATSSTVPVQHVGSNTRGCTSHYELYSSHVKWVNDCPTLSELPPSPGTAQ
jgi:hypothetical protein